jgi:hypothetical protein
MNRAKTVGLLLAIALVGVVGGVALLIILKFELFTHKTQGHGAYNQIERTHNDFQEQREHSAAGHCCF